MEKKSTGGVRFLTGVATLLLVVGVFFGILTIGQAVTGKGRDTIAVHQQVDGSHLHELPADVIRPTAINVTTKLHHASRANKSEAAARDLGPILLTIAFAYLARAILLSVRDGDPFTQDNVKRLRAIGFFMLFGLPALALLDSLMNSALASSLHNNLATTTNLSAAGGLLSIPVFALAEVFAQGARLRLDVEGTV